MTVDDLMKEILKAVDAVPYIAFADRAKDRRHPYLWLDVSPPIKYHAVKRAGFDAGAMTMMSSLPLFYVQLDALDPSIGKVLYPALDSAQAATGHFLQVRQGGHKVYWIEHKTGREHLLGSMSDLGMERFYEALAGATAKASHIHRSIAACRAVKADGIDEHELRPVVGG